MCKKTFKEKNDVVINTEEHEVMVIEQCQETFYSENLYKDVSILKRFEEGIARDYQSLEWHRLNVKPLQRDEGV